MVRLIDYGRGQQELELPGGRANLDEVLRRRGVSTAGRRVAINGSPAGPGAEVVEGDQVSVIPRVQGG